MEILLAYAKVPTPTYAALAACLRGGLFMLTALVLPTRTYAAWVLNNRCLRGHSPVHFFASHACIDNAAHVYVCALCCWKARHAK